jgi:recombinational DNA repair protein RecR
MLTVMTLDGDFSPRHNDLVGCDKCYPLVDQTICSICVETGHKASNSQLLQNVWTSLGCEEKINSSWIGINSSW